MGRSLPMHSFCMFPSRLCDTRVATLRIEGCLPFLMIVDRLCHALLLYRVLPTSAQCGCRCIFGVSNITAFCPMRVFIFFAERRNVDLHHISLIVFGFLFLYFSAGAME